jgi:uncharacterized membrane protein YedE/YeeE
MDHTSEKPFWNPYVAGIALGLVLLASFVVMGFGLGSSGAFNRLGIFFAGQVAPDVASGSAYLQRYLGAPSHVLDDWLVFLVIGIFVGGAFAAYSAGRLRAGVVKGERPIATWQRIALAILGGIIMGFAARLARGCTSGQALTGGSLLSLGSWIFMMAVFAGGYLLAPLVRRQWR